MYRRNVHHMSCFRRKRKKEKQHVLLYKHSSHYHFFSIISIFHFQKQKMLDFTYTKNTQPIQKHDRQTIIDEKKNIKNTQQH